MDRPAASWMKTLCFPAGELAEQGHHGPVVGRDQAEGDEPVDEPSGRRKFTTAFDDVFCGIGTRVIKAPIQSPRANSFAERFVGTIRRECLDHVLIPDERHLRSVPTEYVRRRDRPLHGPAASSLRRRGQGDFVPS